jgi:hypothetical protein
MQYIKHYWISTETNTYCSENNCIQRRHPESEFPGLGVKIWMHDEDGIDICLSTVPDNTSINDTFDSITGKKVVQVLTEGQFNSVQDLLNESSTLSQEAITEQDEDLKAEKQAEASAKYEEAVAALYAL